MEHRSLLALLRRRIARTPFQVAVLHVCALGVLSCSPSDEAAARANPRASAPAQQHRSFAYENTQDWKLYSALLITGVTGVRSTVLFGPDKLVVHQVEKDNVCAHIVADVWKDGQKPVDDQRLQAFVVCPLSDVRSEHEGGEKWLMKVADADLQFNEKPGPIGAAADLFPSRSGNKNLVRMISTILRNDDGTRDERSTYTLWRNVGDHYVMADFAIPESATPAQ